MKAPLSVRWVLATLTLGLSLTLAADAAAAPRGAAPAVRGSVGPGHGVEVPSRSAPCSGTLMLHFDGSAENGYCWAYGGILPPFYGAFAERYQYNGAICGIELILTGLGQPCSTCDAYFWDDAGGIPGNVLAVAGGLNPCPVAIWPSVSVHDFPVYNVWSSGTIWAGYWAGNFANGCGYYVATDEDGPENGDPMTDVAPGIGYPTGWASMRNVWGPMTSIGIGIWTGYSGPPPSGACCRDGVCVLSLAGECPGQYMGNNTNCSPNPCPQPSLGACCEAGGACGVSYQRDCLSGAWTSGAPCTPNPCPPSPPAPGCLRLEDSLHWLGAAHFEGKEQDVAAGGNFACVADSAGGVMVVSLDDPARPALLGQIQTPDPVLCAAVSGSVGLAGGAHGTQGFLETVNLSDAPSMLGAVVLPGAARAIAVSGRYAYVPATGLTVVDLQDPRNPVIAGTAYVGWDGYGVAVDGRWAFVAAGSRGLQMYDVSDPRSPVVTGTVVTSNPAQGVAVVGNRAYLTTGLGGLLVVDISDPWNPALAGTIPTTGMARDLAVSATTAFVTLEGSSPGLAVFDLSNPDRPRMINFAGTYGTAAKGVAVDGTRVVFGHQASEFGIDPGGVDVIEAGNPGPPPVAGLLELPGDHVNDVDVQGTLACLARNSELDLVDVSDPQTPHMLGSVPAHSWGSVRMAGTRAYFTGWSNGADAPALWVADISNPQAPSVLGGVAYVGGDIAVSGHYVYCSEENFTVVDVSDPTHPQAVGSTVVPGQALGMEAFGRYVYVAGGEGGFSVVDVSMPANPRVVATLATPGGLGLDVAVAGRYAYLACTYELEVIDISVPTAPALVSRTAVPDVGLRIALGGSTAYIACGSLGFCAVDVSNPLAPRLQGGPCAQVCTSVAADGAHVYAAVAGLEIFPLECDVTSVTVRPGEEGPFALRVFPNPARRSATLRLDLPASAPVRVEIYDLGGRRVRRIFQGPKPAGRMDLIWDGRDDAGHQVAAGIYQARVSAGSRVAGARIVLLK